MPTPFELKLLAGFGVAFLGLHAVTLGGMGRDVGGTGLVLAFHFVCLYLWPAAGYVVSRRIEGSGRAPGLRRFGYVTGLLLFVGIPFWVPSSVWRALELEDVRFNYFGETLVFTQGLKGLAFAAAVAGALELTRRVAMRH